MAKNKKEQIKKNDKKIKEVKEQIKKVKDSSTEWDLTDGGGDFLKFPTGKYLGRIRSVISCGQVQFTFNKQLDSQATSALALVIELWEFKIKKGKVIIKSDKPAVVYDVMKAFKDNSKSNYGKTVKSLGIKNPSQFMGMAVMVDLYTSEKGYMYVRGALTALGLAEAKATPKLTQKGCAIPNLNMMTTEALLELNPITQVKDYVLKATNLETSDVPKLIKKIRKGKPNFAMLKDKTDDKKPSKKKKKKKLSENQEY